MIKLVIRRLRSPSTVRKLIFNCALTVLSVHQHTDNFTLKKVVIRTELSACLSSQVFCIG